MKKNYLLLVPVLLLSTYNAHPHTAPVNLFIPYDAVARPENRGVPGFQFHVYGQTELSHARGYNRKGNHVNPLQIYSKNQNALAMLEGFDAQSDIGQLRNLLGAVDDGVRGHFIITGDLHNRFSTAFSARYSQCGLWSIGAYLPVYSYELENVVFQDQTKSLTDDDLRVKQLLTNNIQEITQTLGNGLSLEGWKRTGTGDLALFIELYKEFIQPRPFLTQVDIAIESGLILPTGKHEDPDLPFAFPFGSNGAFAIPLRLGLNLHLGYYLEAGVDVELTHTFSHTSEHRIKTAQTQTNLLLLQKQVTYTDYGLTQRFDLYTKFHQFLGGLSVLFGYQFIKHGEDEMFLKTNKFSSTITNTSQTLQDWTMHHVLIKGTYDFKVHMPCDSYIDPQLSLFFRLPFNGKRIAVNPTIGLSFALNF